MDASHNFDQAFTKFQHEVEQNAHQLAAKKQEIEKLQHEIAELENTNDLEMSKMKGRERTIESNKRQIEKLKPELRHLEQKEQEDHRKISSLELENRTRLNNSGVKVHPPHL